LKSCIEKHYKSSCDCTGIAYCGLKIDWVYEKKIVDLSMPGYISAALHNFQYTYPTRPENAPHIWSTPVYGEKTSSLRFNRIALFLNQNM
jgi:hypothetical protein